MPLSRMREQACLLLERHRGALQIPMLELIAAGGTQCVYVDPEKPKGLVYKIPRQLQPTTTQCQADLLCTHFPAQWVPETYEFVADVIASDGARHADIRISSQQFEPEFSNDDRISLHGGYPEMDAEGDETCFRRYRAMNGLLIGDCSGEALEAYLASNPALRTVARLAQSEALFREKLVTFLHSVERYLADAGCIVDLVGRDNLLFMKQGKRWTCRIGDILKYDRLERIAQAFRGDRILETCSPQQIAELLNGLAFVRLLNAVSHILRGQPSMSLKLDAYAIDTLQRLLFEKYWQRALNAHRQQLAVNR